MRRVVCVDFDGVLYDTAKRRLLEEGIAFVRDCVGNGYKVVVHSERCERPANVRWIRQWLLGFDVEDVEISVTKPRADIYIDDKGFRFEGVYPTMEQIFELTEPTSEASCA